MTKSVLFVLTASSSRPDHRRWVKRRDFSQQFALNPPTEDELVQFFSRMNLTKGSKSQIKSAVSMYGYDIRSLREVLQFGPASLENEIKVKVRQLDIVDLESLIKLDADHSDNATHSLIVSRCPDQPGPGTANYLTGDVLESEVAIPAVWKELLLVGQGQRGQE